jgi:hypothetical protein
LHLKLLSNVIMFLSFRVVISVCFPSLGFYQDLLKRGFLSFSLFCFLFSFYFIIFTFNYMCIHCLCYLLPPHPCRPNPFHPLVLRFCWRESLRDKRDILFLLVWDNNSYTERFLVLLPNLCITTHIGSRPLHYLLVSFA